MRIVLIGGLTVLKAYYGLAIGMVLGGLVDNVALGALVGLIVTPFIHARRCVCDGQEEG